MFKELNILRVFLEEPSREFNVREAARLIRVSPATASKELKKFARLGILSGRKERMLSLYKSNLESGLYRDLKVFYNIRRIKDCGLIEALNRFYLKPTIVIFGSSASGTDTETSDLDLMVISENKKHFENLGIFEKKLKRRIHLFAVNDVKELKNSYLINNILNGLVIQGKIKWI